MGRQAFAIGGAVIGAGIGLFIGGPAAAFYGAQAGYALGSVAGSYIDPIVLQGNKVGDNQLQVAAEGGARAIVFGRACITATCIIARGNRVVTKKKTSNGKGSSGSTVNESVSWTFAIGLGEAMSGSSICRIWQDENLVYDVLGDGIVSVADNAKFAAKFRFYDGNETQLPDADLQTFLGVDDTPYFRGTAYVVFPNFDLTTTAERIPIFKFEILQGVAGIVDELETLAWSFPLINTASSFQQVTLTNSPDITLSIDMYITGDMETRSYAHIIDRVGGGGRFIKGADSDSAPFGQGNNIYSIEIDKPHQRYYVNAFLAGETDYVRFQPDGTDTAKISLFAAGDATITFMGDAVDSLSAYAPQFGTIRADLTGINAGGSGTILLGSVIDSLLLRTGMSADQFDTTALDDFIAGVCIQQSSTGAEIIGAIVAPFFADPAEIDGKLMWIKRGAPVVRTLITDDLTEQPDVASRENVIEYPAKLHFFYQSPQTGYATTKSTSSRYSSQANSSGEGSVSSPVTFYTSDAPTQIAAKMHKVAWTEAEGGFTWKVGMHCIDLVPGDCLGLYLRGIATRARITAIENDGSTLILTMLKDRQSSYTSAVTGIPLPTPTAPQPATMSKAVLAVMDIPALQDTDDLLMYYVAASGSTAVWKGGEVQRSIDDGATYTAIAQIKTEATMGRLTASMTSYDRDYLDTVNTVVVQLFDSSNELLSQSDITFDQEQGVIAIQLGDGTWELLQYKNATDGGNGLWTLDTLKRGRLNTVSGAHANGALFVKLDQYLVRVPADVAWVSGTLKHRAVSYTTSSEDADVVSTVYEGRSQIEWSPASAVAQYDGKWVYVHDIVPRYRFGTELLPIASVNASGYDVIVTDGTVSMHAAVPTGDSVHIDTTGMGTITGCTVAGVNRIMGDGETLSVAIETVTAGSLQPEAIVNGGGA